MVDLQNLYNERILELAANIPFTRRLESPQASASAHSKLCGSKIAVDLEMEGDIVTAYGQDVKACLLGQSSASIMGHNIIGATAVELRDIAGQMRRMKGRRPAAWRAMGRSRHSRTRARCAGASCLHAFGLRCGGRCDPPDRGGARR